MNDTAPEPRLGWVSSPDGRGTLDIIWSCLVTVFLCVWSVLCLNLPAKDDTYWQHVWRKFRWALVSVFGPEFLLVFAIGQWCSARRSVKAFRGINIDHHRWSMAHAFFADMGGFVLQPRESSPFPINAKQVFYLVEKGYVHLPDNSKAQIEDRSTTDGFARAITLGQTGWFLLQCLGRAIQRLPTTTLELATVAFVFCSIATYYFWYEKPQDVSTPIVLNLEAYSTADILRRAGLAAAVPYKQTPLDFVDDLRPSWSLTVMPHLGFRPGPKERPFQRLPNDRLPALPLQMQIALCLLTLVYASAHLIGWNFSFASYEEQILWRISCVIHVTTTAAFWIVDQAERRTKKYWIAPPGWRRSSVLIPQRILVMASGKSTSFSSTLFLSGGRIPPGLHG